MWIKVCVGLVLRLCNSSVREFRDSGVGHIVATHHVRAPGNPKVKENTRTSGTRVDNRV